MSKHSIAEKHPDLVNEWHPTKNGLLLPSDVTCGSGKKVWWFCSKGHEWETGVRNRVKGSKCPYCSGNKVIKGENDLQTKYPDIAQEWDFCKNIPLLPNEISVHSSLKVWWKCKNGHAWPAVIGNRTKGHGCPYCSGKKLIVGENDLQTKYPDIAREWDCIKNAPIKPSDIMPNTNKHFWWKCSKGHEWEATPNNRVQGKGCPYCAGLRVIVGENDLLTKNPELAAEWNFEKNYPLRPEDIKSGRNKKAWWKCKRCGFEWEANISSRNRGKGCPKCSRRFHSSFPE